MANPFRVERSEQGGLCVLSLDGFLDAHTAPQFEKALQSEVEAGNTRLIVNGDKLTYISSAGLGVFMSFIEEIREAGGDLRICCLSPKVRQVFDILGFDTIFEIVDSVEAAAARFDTTGVKED